MFDIQSILNWILQGTICSLFQKSILGERCSMLKKLIWQRARCSLGQKGIKKNVIDARTDDFRQRRVFCIKQIGPKAANCVILQFRSRLSLGKCLGQWWSDRCARWGRRLTFCFYSGFRFLPRAAVTVHQKQIVIKIANLRLPLKTFGIFYKLCHMSISVCTYAKTILIFHKSHP